MRFLARLGLGLCGLALVTSAVVKADDPAAPPSDAVVPQAAQVAGHHHKVSLVGGIVSNASANMPRSGTVWTFPRRPRPLRRQQWPGLSFMITTMELPVPLARRALS